MCVTVGGDLLPEKGQVILSDIKKIEFVRKERHGYSNDIKKIKTKNKMYSVL